MAEVWKIIFFADDDGNKPVMEYLRRLSKGERDRFETRLEMLREKGLSATKHLVTKLEDNPYELRLPNSPNNSRFLHCAVIGENQRLCILHGFSKTGKANDKVPESEKRIARARREILLERERKIKKELEFQNVIEKKRTTNIRQKKGRK